MSDLVDPNNPFGVVAGMKIRVRGIPRCVLRIERTNVGDVAVLAPRVGEPERVYLDERGIRDEQVERFVSG